MILKQNFILVLTFVVTSIQTFAQSNSTLMVTDCDKIINDTNLLFGDDGYLLVMSENTIEFLPTDDVIYPFSNFFEAGTDVSPSLDGEYIMYYGDNNTLLDNFENGSTYHYAVFYYQLTNGLPVYSASGNEAGTIDVPEKLTVMLDLEDISCFGAADGSATIAATAGTSPYIFSILGNVPLDYNTGDSIAFANNLVAGNYQLITADANGCGDTSSFIINEPPPFSANVSSIGNISCSELEDGFVEFDLQTSLSGTNLSYSILSDVTIDTISGVTTAQNLAAGTYQLILQQSSNANCADTAEFEIVEPETISLTDLSIANVNCSVGNDGEINLTPSGGNGNFVIEWFDELGSSIGFGNILTGLTAGSYSAVVTDINNCNQNVDVVLSTDFDDCFIGQSFSSSITPNSDGTNDFWRIPGLSTLYPNNQVTICNRWGDVVFETTSCNDDCWNGEDFSSNEFVPTGTYFYVIQLDPSNSDDLLKGTIDILR